jgi:hypothetical protein
MGGSSSSSRDEVKTTRYAPYIEAQHESFLTTTMAYRNSLINNSPFANYNEVEVVNAFFGLGYVISNFPSLYDMFGKRMAGLDIETIWNNEFERALNDTNIDTAIEEEIKLIDDRLVKEDLSEYQLSMRNLNAVPTSSFIVGKAVVEDKRIKLIIQLILDNKLPLLSNIERDYLTRLNSEKSTITIYANIMKDYFTYINMVVDTNTNMNSRDSLWPFTIFSFEGYALGTMRGVLSWRKQMSKRERSSLSTGLSIASYTATGAYIGAEIGSAYPGIGNVVGGVIGGVVGFVVGVAVRLFE